MKVSKELPIVAKSTDFSLSPSSLETEVDLLPTVIEVETEVEYKGVVQIGASPVAY